MDFIKWKNIGYPISTAAHTASQGTSSTVTTQQTSNVTGTPSTKLEDDALVSWRKSKHDVTAYPIIDNDVQYPNWTIRIRRQFIADECARMVDLLVHFSSVIPGGFDVLLWNAQKNNLAGVLDRVLKTNEGMRLVQTSPNDPRRIWREHEAHSTSSTTSSHICTMLAQSLATMKITESANPLQGLDLFDSNLQKFNKVSVYNKMSDQLAVMYLRAATFGNKDLLSAWAACETMHEAMNKPAPTYDEL